jgi:hypothetical protein
VCGCSHYYVCRPFRTLHREYARLPKGSLAHLRVKANAELVHQIDVVRLLIGNEPVQRDNRIL